MHVKFEGKYTKKYIMKTFKFDHTFANSRKPLQVSSKLTYI